MSSETTLGAPAAPLDGRPAAPLFSVVIPVYNRASLLRATLASIATQRFRDFEVIVVDDGSTDGSAEVAREFEPLVRVLRQANKGPGAARNLALRHATGNYVAFLDSDDLWFPWTLGVYWSVIERQGSPSFVTGKALRFEDEAELEELCEETPIECLSFADHYASSDEWRWYGLSSFVVSREALVAAGGFVDAFINGEDADLAMRIGQAPGFVQIVSPVTFAYREHAVGIRHDLGKTLQGVLYQLEQEREGNYPGGNRRRKDRWNLITRYVRSTALECLNGGLARSAWKLYRRTFFWHVGLRRWKFLLGFPFKAAFARRQRD